MKVKSMKSRFNFFSGTVSFWSFSLTLSEMERTSLNFYFVSPTLTTFLIVESSTFAAYPFLHPDLLSTWKLALSVFRTIQGPLFFSLLLLLLLYTLLLPPLCFSICIYFCPPLLSFVFSCSFFFFSFIPCSIAAARKRLCPIKWNAEPITNQLPFSLFPFFSFFLPHTEIGQSESR